MTGTGTARIAVVTAGLGTPSSSRMLADLLSAEAARQLTDTGTAGGRALEVETFELRDFAVDIANAMVSGFAPPRLEEAIQSVVRADALIAVTPVFTASMSGLFKSFFDVLDNTALQGKPVLIGATGGSARHSMVLDFALRPMFGYLRARLMPTAVFAAPEDWAGGSGADGSTALDDRVRRAAGELAAELSAARGGQPAAGQSEAGQEGPKAEAADQGGEAGPRPAVSLNPGTDPWQSLPFEQLLARTRR
ncbi:FMN reductase (NADPH) [Arthrobacter saudimassiliensis]|uniref:FMN reductase (NADPH) n=1 Tax=Arthrobacter saudimassiliensis TaxID=1461584 RepID=A0A078MU92_9MICC|nr:FMN reductase (NADPH) [Arthrobacter saudimassiliensis]